jgi:hypothetical protein
VHRIEGRRRTNLFSVTMTFRGGVWLACLVALPAGAQGGGVPAIGAGRVAAQIAAGTLAEPIGFVGGGLAFRAVARRFGAAEDDASRVADIGAATGMTLTAGTAAALIGARGPGSGSYPAALGGALVGTGVSGLLILLNRKPDDDPGRPCRLTCIVATTAIMTMPSVGATIAYNASRNAR